MLKAIETQSYFNYMYLYTMFSAFFIVGTQAQKKNQQTLAVLHVRHFI